MIEVLKQALTDAKRNERHNNVAETRYWLNQYKLIAEQAIKELESQEPVALPCCGYRDAGAVKWNPLNDVVQCHNCGQTSTPLQRTWQGLTDEEIQKVIAEVSQIPPIDFTTTTYARAIEAKVKEKNT
jgi:hypothetical protein